MSFLGKDWSAIIQNLKEMNFKAFQAGFYTHYYPWRKPDYTPVWEKEWDVLLILDALRYDTAEKYFQSEPYGLEKTTTPGSSSKEWAEHFKDAEELEDIIYISANPHISNQKIEEFADNNPFFMIYDVWKTDWDEENGTVRPEAVNEKFREVKEMYPNKKFILHYMQPHHPFIGEKQLEDTQFLFPENENEVEVENMVWERCRQGEISEEEMIEAYESNLKLVKQKVEKLLPEIPKDKKTVITADHGNLFGEKGKYAHPPGIYFDELVKVPWIETKSEDF